MESREIRKRFLKFFADRGHAILPSASLVTSDDAGVTGATLFNTAGVQPIIPAILAGEHPKGSRLASAQKCVRTTDLDEVGDNTHLTFFEMLGNWSIGDYFKTEAITWSWKLLTDKEEGFGLDPKRLYVTVFEGDENAPRDEESHRIWTKIFENAGLDPAKRIFFMPAENNWWAAGDNGPCGPDTEMFYDVSGKHTGGLTREEYSAADDAQEVVEIWNDVFMEFEKKDGQIIGKLPKQNVDTGSGLERLAMVLQGKSHVYETDMMAPALALIKEAANTYNEASARVIVDHIRTAMFLIADGATPSNTDRGYVLRRLVRKAILKSDQLGIDEGQLLSLQETLAGVYGDTYPELSVETISAVIAEESGRFRKTLADGLREFEKGERDAFVLFTTYGFPVEMTAELARERGEILNLAAFEEKMKAHQEASRAGAEQKFKGGLADHDDPQVVRLHTAHHLLLAALQKVLGPEVKQRGSNITPERLRIDFSFDRKMTPEEKTEVERLVNEAIQNNLSVVCREMPLAEAEASGAEMEFGTKYPDVVSVYFVEDAEGNVFSKEFCGGPHVESTSELGAFRIKKEEASSAGVRRIKAVLE